MAQDKPLKKTLEKLLKKKIFLFSIVFFLCFIGIIGAVSLWMAYFIKAPATNSSQPVTFTVSSGQHFSTIANKLKDQGLISNLSAFKFYVRIKKAATRIKAGEYALNTGMSPKTILNFLISGKNKLYRITVPEGLNMQEIAMLVQQAGLCSSKKFLSLCNDPEFISQLNVPGMTLEGYLFPETYFFSKETDCRALIKKMVSTFGKTFNDTWKAQAKKNRSKCT